MRSKLFAGAAFVGLIVFLVLLGRADTGTAETVAYTEFVTAFEKGAYERVVVDPHERTLTGFPADGIPVRTVYVDETGIPDRFARDGVKVEVRPSSDFNPWPIVTLVIFGVIFFFLWRAVRRMGGSGPGSVIGFAQSKVRRMDPREINVRFDDVIGVDEAKREVMEYLDFARQPQKYIRFGASMPTGILLVGPTGCGKTMLAKALACEAGVPFFTLSGSDFVEMFVGVGAARVRDTMEKVRAAAPCILFIDEIDAVGRTRGAGHGHQNDEREQTLNQILVELDGIAAKPDILVLAATNRPDVLDPALLRPGRFDRKVYLPAPDVAGRQAILERYASSKPVGSDVDYRTLARLTYGRNGADLESLVNEAAIHAVRRNAERIRQSDFEAALEKLELGTERRIRMAEAEKRRVAVHEAGHAVVSTADKDGDPVRKVTVIPRNMALGLTYTLPDEDLYLMTEPRLKAQMRTLFGGRLAEKLVYGDYSTGAADDLKRATAIARDMVMRFGMSEKVGPLVSLDERGAIYLGQTLEADASLSDETRRLIDAEIKAFLKDAEDSARELIETHQGAIKALADALMERETVDGDEVRSLVT